jgi:hypothetical protein
LSQGEAREGVVYGHSRLGSSKVACLLGSPTTNKHDDEKERRLGGGFAHAKKHQKHCKIDIGIA